MSFMEFKIWEQRDPNEKADANDIQSKDTESN